MTKIHSNDRSSVYRVHGLAKHPPICVSITTGWPLLSSTTAYLTADEAAALARQLDQAVADVAPVTVAL